LSEPVVVVASLWVRPGRLAEFEAYERKAARILDRYGASIERTVRFGAADAPTEIHVVHFPSLATFEAYRNDAELKALAEERAAAIEKTSIAVGEPGPGYGPVGHG